MRNKGAIKGTAPIDVRNKRKREMKVSKLFAFAFVLILIAGLAFGAYGLHHSIALKAAPSMGIPSASPASLTTGPASKAITPSPSQGIELALKAAPSM